MTLYASPHAWSYSMLHCSPRERAQGLEQRVADDVVVLGLHVELAVVAAQGAQVFVEPLRVVERLHGRDDRAEQPGALHVHVDREKVSQVRVGQEDACVEVAGDLVLLLLDEGPAFLQQPREVTH